MDPVVHFEIPYTDGDRARNFYTKTFGWQFPHIPEMQYTIARTTETDDRNMPKAVGRINGGLTERTDSAPYPVLVITVDRLDDAIATIEANGGSVIMPKMQVGDAGLYARVRDTEGNIIGVWEELKKAPPIG